MGWITRERLKIDRMAYPWLIARFIDLQTCPAVRCCGYKQRKMQPPTLLA